MSHRKLFLVLLICTSFTVINGQGLLHADSFKIAGSDGDSKSTGADFVHKFSAKKLIVPAAFITVGALSLTSDFLKNLNSSTRYEIGEHQPTHTKWDNYAQYAPAALVYGLNLTGIKGKHNFQDRTMIYATLQLISAAVVTTLKHTVNEKRPDGSDNLSFPSGHTATAFSSAHFMFKEYRDENFVLSISGYSFALFTGIYRTLNNKHWVGDVVAGAGIGIILAEAAYWLYPTISRIMSSKQNTHNRLILPNYANGSAGLTFNQNF